MTSKPLCKYPGCYRTPGGDIHGVEWSCKRCAKDGGHTYWNYYLSVNRYRPLLKHHDFVLDVIKLTPPPEMDGVTFID